MIGRNRCWSAGRVRLGLIGHACIAEPDVILTHESDLDGLVAGVLLQRLARKLFDTNVRLEACHYNNWKQREPREKRVGDGLEFRGAAWTSRTGW